MNWQPNDNEEIIIDAGNVEEERISKIGQKMLSRIRVGGVELSLLNIIMILIINLAVVSALINVLVATLTDFKMIWDQYVIGALVVFYLLCKATTVSSKEYLSYGRNMVYVIEGVLLLTAIFNKSNVVISNYIMPSLFIALTICAGVLFLMNKATRAAFLCTIIFDTIFSVIMVIIVAVGVFPRTTPGIIINSTSLGLSGLILINYVFFRIMLLHTKINDKLEKY